ncbi:hypothetical protein [Streptomyces apocyni]|uniref:hypothetical protein n=1 Tax=Streptomyces apocyni TaxID=2654677 RepID=UPI0012EAB3D7|nr:hypothetical protein [Streptomyces apocyni]
MAATGFSIEVDGSSGAHAGRWAEGSSLMVLPDAEHRAENAAAYIELVEPGNVLSPAVSRTPAPTRATRPPTDPSARQVTVAEVEARMRTLTRTGEMHPLFVLRDADQRALCSVRPEPLPKGEPRWFTVLDEHLDVLATIDRGRPHRFGRYRWRIEFADGRTPLIGYKGGWPDWLGFVLLLPLWCLFFAVSLLVALVTLSEGVGLTVWSCPKHIAWRPRGAWPFARAALEFRHMSAGYRYRADQLDPRIAYAQAAVHQFAQLRG